MSFIGVNAQELDANAQRLPGGYYVYLGPKPGRLPPRGLVLENNGDVKWQTEVIESKQTTSSQESTKANGAIQAQDLSQPWEVYKYPLIKWKAHPVTSAPGAIAQLTTTLDVEHMYETPVLKYKLTLFKIQPIPYFTTVELQDSNGFKVKEFQVSAHQFHAVPGTALFEASDQVPFFDANYKDVREYTVK